jgi:hypothetical protein
VLTIRTMGRAWRGTWVELDVEVEDEEVDVDGATELVVVGRDAVAALWAAKTERRSGAVASD